MNGIVAVRPDVALKILIDYYGQKWYQINTNQILVLLIPQGSEVTNTQIPVSEIHNMAEDEEETEGLQ